MGSFASRTHSECCLVAVLSCRTRLYRGAPFFRSPNVIFLLKITIEGKQVGDKDENFREKYYSYVDTPVDDDCLVLCYIDEKVRTYFCSILLRLIEKVGFGVFANRPFKEGEFITHYFGSFQKAG